MTEWRLDRLEERFGALQLRRESRVSLSDLQARYAADPVGFAEQVCGARLWDRQKEIALAVRDGPQVAVASGHAIGKDFVSALLALWWCFVKGGLCLVTSATQRQVAEQFFGEVARAFRRADLPGECFQTLLRVPGAEGACGILGFTSESASSYSGFHGARVLIVLSEAQGIEPDAWVGLESCATGADDRIVALGNPLSNSGRFYECFRSPAWRTFQLSCYEHPNLTGVGPFIPGGPTAVWIDRVRADWGEASSIFQSRVLARFPVEDEQSLVRRAWLEAAAARYAVASPPTRDVTVAVDVGRYGSSLTAVAVVEGATLRALETWHGTDLMETVGRVQLVARRWGCTPRQDPTAENGHIVLKARGVIWCDEPGLGAGCIDRLREVGYAVEAFNGGARPRAQQEQQAFLNLRAEAYWSLRRQLEAREIGLSADPLVWDELTSLKWRVNSAGKVQLEDKVELAQRLGRSPDRSDSIVMAFHGAAVGSLPGGFTFNL